MYVITNYVNCLCYIWCADVMVVTPAVPSHHSEYFRYIYIYIYIYIYVYMDTKEGKKMRRLDVASSLFAVGKYSSFISEI